VRRLCKRRLTETPYNTARDAFHHRQQFAAGVVPTAELEKRCLAQASTDVLSSLLDELPAPCDVSVGMEYTDSPSTAIPAAETDQMACPFCGHMLPKDAQRCDRCDWTRSATETVEGKASDAVAVMLSVIPGLGHIYKGHKLVGALIMFVGTPMAIAIAALTFTFTAGFGGLLLPLWWFGVMFHVYGIEDRVGPPKEDEGEQY
jgi:hypothetical protein